jgi:hypothetical protein
MNHDDVPFGRTHSRKVRKWNIRCLWVGLFFSLKKPRDETRTLWMTYQLLGLRWNKVICNGIIQCPKKEEKY